MFDSGVDIFPGREWWPLPTFFRRSRTVFNSQYCHFNLEFYILASGRASQTTFDIPQFQVSGLYNPADSRNYKRLCLFFGFFWLLEHLVGSFSLIFLLNNSFSHHKRDHKGSWMENLVGVLLLMKAIGIIVVNHVYSVNIYFEFSLSRRGVSNMSEYGKRVREQSGLLWGKWAV